MNGFFVTGTDTGVGKTVISVALIERLKESDQTVAGIKPVASGSTLTPEGLRNEDALLLQAHANKPLPYELINPVAFEPPIAPHLAAKESGETIQVDRLLNAINSVACQSDKIIVEGVGGWLVPLNASETMADLAEQLRLPVIVVVGIRLGCINHAMLTFQSIQSSKCTLAGWIANHIDPGCERAADILQAIDARVPAPCLGTIPWMDPTLPAAEIASFLNL